ncbi:MAG: glycosyltransferase [Bacteroidia bacterium]
MITNETDGIIKAAPPQKSEITIIRILICCGMACMLMFTYWFINPEHIGYSVLYWLLTFGLSFKLVKMIHEWYHYWSPSVPQMPVSKKQWTVDILTTACPGEPKEMIIRTLRAMQAIHYPHTSYLCDEGDDPELKKVCEELGVIHVTRIVKTNAKAGNINNALQQARGEICLVLDPDHVPVPEFLDRVLPYFEDESIGFVQCVQGYGNQDESFIARGAAEQTYHFYGPMMMCMNSYGTVQAIGANCTFRRKALDSIGGHAAGLSEDMHTAMQLHAKGWKSIYVPEMLTRGLVPATLSGYYKQQLKWSRGTFELLFRTYPQLYKNFTWRQKIHYFTIPLYFLFGLINLIDIAIPLLALALAEAPWEINIEHFGMFFLPLCALSMVIRLYAQRWLLEKHERGFHFAGGILRTATWWVFLIGFIYTIFNIKVPYIPTPKEDEHQNYVALSVPNFLILLTTTLFVIYGLSIDWTPYSIAMAGYSLLTASMLGFTVIMSQQKTLFTISAACKKTPTVYTIINFIASLFNKSQQVAYHSLKSGAIVLLLSVSIVFLSYSNLEEKNVASDAIASKELGSFYLGTTLTSEEIEESKIRFTEQMTGVNFNVISFQQEWRKEREEPFALQTMNAIRKYGAIPFIEWHPDANSTKELWKNLKSGEYSSYLKKCVTFFRTYKDPIFISFQNTASNNEKQSSEDFINSWQYLYTFFNHTGVSNLTWVWCPTDAQQQSSYPGEKFTDWIGVSCLNYGSKKNSKDYYSFTDIYEPVRKNYGQLRKPIMITQFGSVKGCDQALWYNEGLEDIQNKYPEIRSIVMFNNVKKFEFITDSVTSLFEADFALEGITSEIIGTQLKSDNFMAKSFAAVSKKFNAPDYNYKSKFIKGEPGKFELHINKQPYYIKGIAYNTAHDWRDGNMPLTRRQVVKDFQRIKEMGANTIRRYGTGIYDKNILNISEEYGLNVLYGFWFDPKIDYYADSTKVEEYIKEVEESVIQYRNYPSVIAWSLGNESWGLLKHKYAKPYLVKVRQSYVQLIEHLAQRIHELDPTRPVLTCMEHEGHQLPGEIATFRDDAPSIDVIGINSYYKEQISALNHVTWQFDSLRPYLVSEFGPRGYWDPNYNKTSKQDIIEETDAEKASWYKEQWTNYVEAYKGNNIGGIAYCWHDRMEGSYTWFGITDYKGRVKPSYYALMEVWTNKKGYNVEQYNIVGPSQIEAGETYTFSVVNKKGVAENKLYEWRLLKDEYLKQIDNIELTKNPYTVQVQIPKEPSKYRLYVFVTDKENGRVTTSSTPIQVSQKKL